MFWSRLVHQLILFLFSQYCSILCPFWTWVGGDYLVLNEDKLFDFVHARHPYFWYLLKLYLRLCLWCLRCLFIFISLTVALPCFSHSIRHCFYFLSPLDPHFVQYCLFTTHDCIRLPRGPRYIDVWRYVLFFIRKINIMHPTFSQIQDGNQDPLSFK